MPEATASTESAPLKKGQRILFRRSILSGRAPEFGVVVKRHKDEPNFAGWYHVRYEGEPNSKGCSEHFSMIAAAGDGWREREVERLIADADEAMRLSNSDPVQRFKAEALRACAERLIA